MERSRAQLVGVLCVLGLCLLCTGQSLAASTTSPVRERISFALVRTLYDALPQSFHQVKASDLASCGYLADSVFFAPGAISVEAKPLERGLAAGDGVDELDDYETPDAQAVYDPFEGWNRFWFRFNDKFYLYVADPIYRGWQAITPHQLRTGLKNFFHNLLFPVRFVNNLLQFKFKAAGVEFGRFMMNTMCSVGFADPASTKKTIVPVDSAGEDFGQTLGYWGVGHGPYLVWPFIGPSSFRETLGRIGDFFTEPFFYVQPWWAGTSASFALRFNDLDEVLPLYQDLTGAALDPYIAMREAYINYRNLHVRQ
ncbi:MAG: VacJ family lipoprotein [Desulfovibrio sp.]|nr:VacJ family lipoprotein [Desulfovibrio sp.]